jgi:hypothetical protein
MQSYREEAGSRPPVSQLDPLPAPSVRDDMSTYRARYEEAMNPFEAFRGRVSFFFFGAPGILYLPEFPNNRYIQSLGAVISPDVSLYNCNSLQTLLVAQNL